MTPRRFPLLRELWDALRANPLEFGLLLFALVAIGATMAATTAIATTYDPRRDLTFAGAVKELSRTLKDRGPDQVGVIRRATFAVGTDSVFVDTLAITADSSAEPTFARGGFVRDQVYRFNDQMVRRAVRGLADARTRSRIETGSVFRLVYTDSGHARLSDTADALGLVIRSPYAEGTWRPVRTVDWRSSPALLGYDGQLSLGMAPDSSRSRAVLNGRECEVRAETRARHLIYCTATVGRAVDRFFDVGFTTKAAPSGATFDAMFPYRPRDVWVNGKLERFTNRATTAGTLVELRSTGGFLLSSADWGTLATEQWINGRTTFLNQRNGTLSFFGRAGRSARNNSPIPAPLTLSFDARLSLDLERDARRFLSEQRTTLRRMAVVLMDVKSGEIRAIAEPHRQSDDESLLSFEPLLIGSAVKPIVAAALLSRQPALAQLRLDSPDSLVTEVGGIPLRKPFRSSPNGCAGPVDITQFLQCSNNQFAAELVVRSLQRNGYKGTADGIVPRGVLEESDIANGLAQVFDVDPYAGRTSGRFASYWKSADTTLDGGAPIIDDQTLIPWESRPWLVFPKRSGTPVDLIARYAFGGWENRWTLVGTAQAYARIVTDKNIQGTFLHAATPVNVPPASAKGSALSVVRRGLRRVAVDGTARGLHAAFQIEGGKPLAVFAKTGTLNEGEANGNTRMKALVLGVGETVDATDGAPLMCGLVAVTYFEFDDDWNARGGQKALPSVHLDFAKGPLATVLTRQWRRVSGCPAPVVRPVQKSARGSS
jgi:hypothetical protein